MRKELFALAVFLSVLAVPVLADDLNSTLLLQYLPYIEPSTTVTIQGAFVDSNLDMILGATLTFEFNSTNYTMPFNPTTSAYEIPVLFGPADIGNWTFNVYAEKAGYVAQQTNGTVKVREPIIINFRLYKDTNATIYVDNFAQVIMKANYDCSPLITFTTQDTYSGETLYYSECYYHANYTSGNAQFRIYEKGVYSIYVISGQMSYLNSFAYPTVDRQTYKLTVGDFTINGDTNLNIVMSWCDLNPQQCQRYYFSLFLWVFFMIIAGVVGIIAGKYGGAGAGIGVAIVVLLCLILLRFALLGY